MRNIIDNTTLWITLIATNNPSQSFAKIFFLNFFRDNTHYVQDPFRITPFLEIWDFYFLKNFSDEEPLIDKGRFRVS